MSHFTKRIASRVPRFARRCLSSRRMEDKGWQIDAENIFRAGLRSVQPKHLSENATNFEIRENVLRAAGKQYELNKNVYIVGFGKAALGLVNQVGEKVGSHLIKGIVSCPSPVSNDLLDESIQDITHLRSSLSSHVDVYFGPSNNIPNKVCVEASQEIANLVDSIDDERAILLTIITGGGSALLSLPLKGIELEDMMEITKLMSRNGCDINEMNTVRKQIEQLKGGGLAVRAHPMQVVSLILSDIVDDPLETIASGPTVENPQSVNDAISVLNQRKLWNKVPERIQNALSNLEKSTFSSFNHVNNLIIGSNSVALKSAEQCAIDAGYTPFILTRRLGGDAVHTARLLVSIVELCLSCNESLDSATMKHLTQLLTELNGGVINADTNEMVRKLSKAKKFCLLAGGEVTVEVPQNAGFGGRAAQTALAAAGNLQKLQDEKVVILVGSTDGLDGPTHKAGAWVTNKTRSQIESEGLDLQDALRNCDAYGLFEKLNGGINMRQGGLTGTNVMDIVVITVDRQR